MVKIDKYKAQKKWQSNNKELVNYSKDRSKSKSFIKNKATLEDLEELTRLIEEKKLELEK